MNLQTRIVTISAFVVVVMALGWMVQRKYPVSDLKFPNPVPTTSITPATLGEKSELVSVTRVVDGDTIEIEGGVKVRYIGIDTPETSDPRKPVQCFGQAAAEKNRELVEGAEVRLEKDVSETDRYGRLLRYIYVGEEMVNEKLVKEGYARASAYPPDIKYQDKFSEAETEARLKNLGLWGECNL